MEIIKHVFYGILSYIIKIPFAVTSHASGRIYAEAPKVAIFLEVMYNARFGR